MKPIDFFRCAVIVGTLPVTLTNGTTGDATQVMADLNWLVNQVNANAAPLSNTALLNATNNFTAVQSGLAATAGANFPIASQVQNWSFNTLTSTLGTNLITARIAQLAISAYTPGQVFTFIPSQSNTGAVGITIDAAGSSSVFSQGRSFGGGELALGVPAMIERDATKFNLLSPPVSGLVRAWGFSAPSTTINSSFPASGASIAKTATGKFTITHGITFASANYCATVTAESAGGAVISVVNSRSTTQFFAEFYDAAGVAVDPSGIHYACFGVT